MTDGYASARAAAAPDEEVHPLTRAYMAAGVVGLGIIQAPTFMAHQHLLSGALRSILTDWTPGVIPLHIVYPPNRHMSNKLRVFVDWIADLFATNEFMRRSPQS